MASRDAARDLAGSTSGRYVEVGNRATLRQRQASRQCSECGCVTPFHQPLCKIKIPLISEARQAFDRAYASRASAEVLDEKLLRLRHAYRLRREVLDLVAALEAREPRNPELLLDLLRAANEALT